MLVTFKTVSINFEKGGSKVEILKGVAKSGGEIKGGNQKFQGGATYQETYGFGHYYLSMG